MHEVGIASEILRASHAETARRPGARLVAVTVRIGVLAGVDADALRFAWDVMSEQAEYAPVALMIQMVPRRNRCQDCGREYESGIYSEPCPGCASENSLLLGGDEMQLASVEVEE
ncbi:MAG: hydrogenase maturation nickel metallochaperone HypA/HybF [Acidobacteriaceae bacterium]|jgi:hydrogenase nickel incorporation protein HypA/HybF